MNFVRSIESKVRLKETPKKWRDFGLWKIGRVNDFYYMKVPHSERRNCLLLSGADAGALYPADDDLPFIPVRGQFLVLGSTNDNGVTTPRKTNYAGTRFGEIWNHSKNRNDAFYMTVPGNIHRQSLYVHDEPNYERPYANLYTTGNGAICYVFPTVFVLED